MPIPPQLLKAIQAKRGISNQEGPPDAQDPPGSKKDTNPFLARQSPKKKKKKYTKAQQEALSRKLSGGKGSGRN